jgi:hypothetical protein
MMPEKEYVIIFFQVYIYKHISIIKRLVLKNRFGKIYETFQINLEVISILTKMKYFFK